MHYTKLGDTGLDVSRICLGCMNFGAQTPGAHEWSLDEMDTRPLLERALELGINFFDTANAYSRGTSEEITGKLLRELADRDEVVIATKVYFPMRGTKPNSLGLSRKAIMTEIEHSLRRLGTDYIDLYQIHRYDRRTPIEETLRAFDDAISAGKIRYVGASSMWAWEFSKALYTAKINGWNRFVSMQNQYSLLQREEEREMLPLCADQGIGVIPWSPLARGVLTRDWDDTTARTETDPLIKARFDRNRDEDIVKRVAEIAAARDVPRAQIALAWVLGNPVVTAPIVGASKLQHIEDAVAALDVELTTAEREALEEPYVPRSSSF
ncbi:MAG: aldo/keto reductase [Pseudomonadota bacterium]